MHDCIFGHYLVTLAWTVNHTDFELVWVGFCSCGILLNKIYTNLARCVLDLIQDKQNPLLFYRDGNPLFIKLINK